jgi:uncharacterized protein YgbK (DUF1537 family)
MTPDRIEAELRPALAGLKALGAAITHYKVCSTFDSSPQVGSIGRAIDVGREIFPDAPFIPLLVGAPALGRYCVFGNLFARSGRDSEPYRLDRHPSMSRHPVTPADESDIRVHLARQTDKRIGLLDVLRLALPPDARRTALEALLAKDKPDIVLFDVLHKHQLPDIGRLIDRYASSAGPLFAVGSSGMGTALGTHWASLGNVTPPDSFPDPGPAEPLLVASGSCSPVTDGQIAQALAHGFAEVALDTATLAADDSPAVINRAVEAVVMHLRAKRCVVLHTSRGAKDPRVDATAEVLRRRRGPDGGGVKSTAASLLGGALGRVVRAAIERADVRRLLVAGGDTSGHLAHALGIESMEMIAPLTPGAPLCRVRAPGSPADGLEVNFKGGQVGGENYFDVVRRGRPGISNQGV